MQLFIPTATDVQLVVLPTIAIRYIVRLRMGVCLPSIRSSAVVDLFCGVGGLTHGFIQEGFRVLAGYDSDVSCKYAFETNNETTFIHQSIERTTGVELEKRFADAQVKVLVGCAPCQPFSLYTVKQEKDDKWNLLLEFSRLISEVEPEIVSMENVPELARHSIFEEFVAGLKRLGYHVTHQVVFCPDYGVPQSRRRLVLFASKFGAIDLIRKTHRKNRRRTVWSAIGNLEPLVAGGRSKRDRIHRARQLNATNLARIRHTKEGGSWKDWPDSLKLACHKKKTGKTYRSIYGRMEWKEPAPTLTTHCTGIGNGRFGHPEQDRAISLREAALLQTFPRRYKFVHPRDKVWNKTLSRQIGNAVPVRLGRVIARSIGRHLQEVKLLANQRPTQQKTAKPVDGSRENEGHRSRVSRKV